MIAGKTAVYFPRHQSSSQLQCSQQLGVYSHYSHQMISVRRHAAKPQQQHSNNMALFLNCKLRIMFFWKELPTAELLVQSFH